MDAKVIVYFLILAGLLILSFLLMNKTKKGRLTYAISIGILLILNLIHLTWLLSLPSSKFGARLGEAVGYVIATLLEAVILFVIAILWYFFMRNRESS